MRTCVYSISGIFQDIDARTEKRILEDYTKSYVLGNESEVRSWGIVCSEDGVGLRLAFTENGSEV